MKKHILLLALLSPIALFAQKTLLYCGKLVDVKAGKVQTAYTIVVEGKKIQSIQAGYLPAGKTCLLYTSDAADEEDSVDLGGRRIIKKKNFFQAEDGIRDAA